MSLCEVLPEPPVVSLSNDLLEVYFSSPQRQGGDLDGYTLSVYDNTEGRIFYDVFTNDTNKYRFVSNILNSESVCSPHLVSVSAFNTFGSISTNVTVNNSNDGDVCSCVKNNGML